MSHQCLADAFAPAEAAHKERVMQATWGHLAPKRNKTYTGRVVYAIGCYDSGELNPTPIVCEFKGLDDSPWFYEAINEWLQGLTEENRKMGCVYEFKGTFRNYQVQGVIRLLLDTN
jgi:hypothetical protein